MILHQVEWEILSKLHRDRNTHFHESQALDFCEKFVYCAGTLC